MPFIVAFEEGAGGIHREPPTRGGRLMPRSLPAAARFVALLIGAFAWMTGGTGAYAQTTGDSRTLIVIGTSGIQGGQGTAARDAAIASSLMSAVALAAVEILTPEVFAENFKKLNEQLLSRPEAYIQDFRVLSEAAVARQHRVVVKATVAVKQMGDYLAGAGLARGKTAVASKSMAVTVEGSGNLANFVKFRRGLGGVSGVEGIQVKDMMPNETTLLVTYRGTAQDLAAALMQQAFEGLALNVSVVGEDALRVALAPK
jgi:hypothetical protein